jgi:HEPN domain-containing protein
MRSKKKAGSFTSGPEAWLHFALDDQKAAINLMKDGPWNMVCFHTQQASEKSLKAFLRSHSYDVPRVHSLGKLIELCSKHDRTFLRLKSTALSLDRYYISTRYPEAAPGMLAHGLPEKSDAKAAIAEMKRITRLVAKRLKHSLRGPLGI